MSSSTTSVKVPAWNNGQRPASACFGGSGLYAWKGSKRSRSWKIETPFGARSDRLRTWQDRRPGGGVPGPPRRHQQKRPLFTASEVPYRANLWALRSLGVALDSPPASVRGFAAGAVAPARVLCPINSNRSHPSAARSAFSAGGPWRSVGNRRSLLSTPAACWAMWREPDAHRAASCTAAATYLCMEGPRPSRPGRIQPLPQLGLLGDRQMTKPQRGPAWPGKPKMAYPPSPWSPLRLLARRTRLGERWIWCSIISAPTPRWRPTRSWRWLPSGLLFQRPSEQQATRPCAVP